MLARSPSSKVSGKRRRRLGLLIFLGMLFILAAWGYCHFWLIRPVGHGPAGPAVDRKWFEKTWTDKKMLLLGLGDSVTAGFGVPPDHGYVARLADNPDDEWPDMQGLCLRRVLPELSVRNMAISGSTSINHLDVIQGNLETQEPDVLGLVVMTTGGNDLIHYYGRRPPREGAMYGATMDQARPWIEAFERRLGEMLDRLNERFPGGCHVFLADIYDPSDGVGDPPAAGLPAWPDCMAILAAYNDIIHRAAASRENVHLVPMHDAFLGHGVHCVQPWREHYCSEDPHYWYGRNLEDPNARGYDAIRRLFLIEMAKALAPESKPTTKSTEPRPAQPEPTPSEPRP